jgi:hypothetical protein
MAKMPVLFLKAHVNAYTRSDGTVVQAHDTKMQASVAKPKHRQIVEAATYSAGRHEEHSVSHTAQHSSRAIRVPSAEKAHAMDHARDTFAAAGLKRSGSDVISGAEQYESPSHAGEIWHNNGTVHVSVKRKSKAAAPAGDPRAPADGEVGHEEYKAYGKYFRKGDKVRDPYGKTHEVMEHRGSSVSTYSGQSFHPTKLWHAD